MTDNNRFTNGTAEFEDYRKTLLQKYHSEILTHAGYILALIIGALTLVSRFDIFFDKGPPFNAIFLIIVSTMFGLGFYFTCRLCYWVTLESNTLSVREQDFASKFATCKSSCISFLQKYVIDNIEIIIEKNIEKSSEKPSIWQVKLWNLGKKPYLIIRCSLLLITSIYIIFSSLFLFSQFWIIENSNLIINFLLVALLLAIALEPWKFLRQKTANTKS